MSFHHENWHACETHTNQCLLPKNSDLFEFFKYFSDFTVTNGACELELAYSMSLEYVYIHSYVIYIEISKKIHIFRNGGSI